MTSEVEHDILVGPDGAWSNAAGGAAGQPAAAAEALQAAEAAAAAARSALSSAQVGPKRTGHGMSGCSWGGGCCCPDEIQWMLLGGRCSRRMCQPSSVCSCLDGSSRCLNALMGVEGPHVENHRGTAAAEPHTEQVPLLSGGDD